ncbi:MAG: hypothetical protein Q8936_23170 [Bacillota bacterium]|nr:hypothetical protein [Bacillota bacterium]
MEFHMNAAYKYISDVVNSDANVTEGMKKIISYCSSYCASSIWGKIMNLDFEGDKYNLMEWMQYNLTNDPLSNEVDALWFGLFNGVLEDDEVCVLYLSGINCVNNGKENMGWDFEHQYLPEHRYADSKVLNDISIMLKNEGGVVSRVGEYIIYLGYTCLVIANILKELDKVALLRQRSVLVGFDSGDYIQLKPIVTI